MPSKIAIIGAGLAGLTLARELEKFAKITVFEKSRGVSGRMSTRYAGGFEFDHGAQYFTATQPGFRKLVNDGISAGVLDVWNPVIDMAPGHSDNGRVKFVGRPRMNSWLKHLSDGLNVKVGEHIENIQTLQEEFDWVISTAPLPQTAALFPKNFGSYDKITAATYLPCFAVMLGLTASPDTAITAWRHPDRIASWIAINSAKPGREIHPTMVIHGQGAWSAANVDADRDLLMEKLIADARETTGINLESFITHKAIHRWLYAFADKPVGESFLLDPDLKLAACGDGLLGPRVELAWQSAFALAQELKRRL